MKRLLILGSILGFTLLFGLNASPAVGSLPELAFEAPPELQPVAERLRVVDSQRLAGIVELVGLESAGEPIRVILASEDSEAAASSPPWVSGYAYGSLGTIVLLAERVPSYPDSSLAELLRHEVAHVLVSRAAGGRPVPRWFNEGVAMLAADVWRLNDRSRLAISSLLRGKIEVEEIEEMFAGDRAQVERAYALSGALVRDIALRYRDGAPGEVLSLMRRGVPFERAFLRGTGRTVEQVERSFWRRNAFWYRWLPIVSSSISGWTLLSFLMMYATYRKKRATSKIYAHWQEEEAAKTALETEAATFRELGDPEEN